jgi:hypothetical protein
MPLIIKKIFSLSTLALVVALTLSAIAAWYSVVGLTAIFAAAVIPIIIMGGSLEVAKVVTTVWLHRYWDKCKWAMKTYLTGAVIVLALVTSMGIFGFLSKAHMDQGIPTGDVAAQIQLLDEKINIQKELIASERTNIEAARKTLSQMDAQLTARLDRGDSEAGVERAVQIRAQQRRERTALNSEIGASQKRIEKYNQEIQNLNLEKAPIAAKFRKIEAEVGPIKYIAALIYGDNPDTATLERAVRWVIILLIFVFDPLALMLVIAAISSYKWEFESKREEKHEPFINNGSNGYLPLGEDELESRSKVVIEPEEPKAGNIELTADGGILEQENPVKKKLSERLKQKIISLKLPRYNQIKLEELRLKLRDKLNLKYLSNKLHLSLNQLNVREKLSWKNLTNWNKSPILLHSLKLYYRIKSKFKK